MQELTRNPQPSRTNREALSPQVGETYRKSLWILLLAGTLLLASTIMLSACGSSSSGSPQSATLAGNWQFTLANPGDGSFQGPTSGSVVGSVVQGGFLLQKNDAVTGQVAYSVYLPGTSPTLCNGGTATITGKISGQTVTLTAEAGSTQTFTFTGGTLSSDGTTITGGTYAMSYVSPNGQGCGTAQSALSWSARSVPPLTGSITGAFHSAFGSQNAQDYPLTGFLTQGENIGASNATVTGTLSFIDPATSLTDYPCIADGSVSVNGEISGDSVILQLIGTSGLPVGQIGGSISSGVNTVTFDSTSSGNVLHSALTPAYAIFSKPCFGGGSLNTPGDSGSICLALSSPSACQQPITLSPAVILFSPQMLGSTPTTQTITLTNISGSTLNNLTWNPQNDTLGDFTGLPSFTFDTTAGDPCAGVQPGAAFSLNAGQSCAFKVTFTPQQSCPWLPFAGSTGVSPVSCPSPLTGSLVVHTDASKDLSPDFKVPISGNGVSFIQPSTPELDFGAEAVSETSLPQLLTFTNHSAFPVQILPRSTAPCPTSLPHSPQDPSQISGLQVVSDDGSSPPNITLGGTPLTVSYFCDGDPNSVPPKPSNFQISSDTCMGTTGTTLQPQATCSLEITYVPQAGTIYNASGLDYFLELNTLQCYPIGTPPSESNHCEIDSGRFPVELKANSPSPLRMSPGAGLDFGSVTVGQASAAQTITLFNDPNDPSAGTVNFPGKVSVSGSYSETDDCGFSLAPGSSCTLTVTFKPKAVGVNQGKLTISYTQNQIVGTQTQTAYMRGTGQ